MLTLTPEQWEQIPKDYKGIWTQAIYEFRGGDFPVSWIGKRTMITYDPASGATVLLTEGVSFEITGEHPDAP